MTVQTTTRRARYVANGVTTEFSFAFKVFSTNQIKVTQGDDTSETEVTTGFTVTLNADQDTNPGGKVTFVTAPTSGTVIALTSVVPFDQQMVFTNQGGFRPDLMNTALDKLTALTQQNIEQISRSFKTPATSSETPETLLNSIFSARDTAVAKASEASGSATTANTAATNATTAKTAAEAAQAAAEDAEEGAEEAKDIAVAAVGDIDALQAVATTLPAGSQATASYTRATHTLTLGLPQGQNGADGADGEDGLDGGSVVDAEVTSGGNLLLTIDPTYTGNVDDQTSTTSPNPISNRAITNALNTAVPSQTGKDGKFLMTNGTNTSWKSIPDATTSASGLISASDKTKLDGIGAGANVQSVNGQTGAVIVKDGVFSLVASGTARIGTYESPSSFTVTDLTPYKILIILIYSDNNNGKLSAITNVSNVLSITSTEAPYYDGTLVGLDGDFSIGNSVGNSARYLFVIPTSSAITITWRSGSTGEAGTGHYYFYQA